MDKYKLYNIYRKSLKNFDNVKKMKFSFKLINELFDKYHLEAFMEKEYCCKSEDFNCWIEIEGEEMGWVFARYKEKYRRKALRKYVMDILHEKDMKKNLYNRNIYYAEDEDCISIHIPMRDLCLRDYIIYFDKTWV